MSTITTSVAISLPQLLSQPLDKKPSTLRHAVRQYCINCMGGSLKDVRECISRNCALHPFRMGRNPNRAPKTAKQIEAAKAAGRGLRAMNEPRINAESTVAAAAVET